MKRQREPPSTSIIVVDDDEDEEDEFEPLFSYSRSVGPAPTFLSDDSDDEDEVIIAAAPRRKPETVPAKGPQTPTPQKASTTSVVLDDDDDSWLLCSTPKLPTMPQPTENLALLQLRQKRRELMMLQEASSPGALKKVEEAARMQAQQRVQAESSPSVVRALKPQVEPSSDAPTSEEMEKVLIKFQNKSGNCQSIRIFSNDKFEKLFTVYANKVQTSLSSLSFRFDGDQLSPSTTPKELDMEDGDVIEVYDRN
jgi:hypothetical protein